MPKTRLQPRTVMADEHGNIYDAPQLLMVCRRGGQWGLPRPDEMLVLPPGGDLFLLPGRRAAGLDPRSGRITCLPESTVAAFVAPGHTLSAHPAYKSDANTPCPSLLMGP